MANLFGRWFGQRETPAIETPPAQETAAPPLTLSPFDERRAAGAIDTRIRRKDAQAHPEAARRRRGRIRDRQDLSPRLRRPGPVLPLRSQLSRRRRRARALFRHVHPFVAMASRDFETFRRFANAADRADSGDAAARAHLGFSVAHLVEAVLGEGPWTPEPQMWNEGIERGQFVDRDDSDSDEDSPS